MSERYPGGLITKSPVIPTTTSAPGIWTIEQALQYIKAGTWPSPPVLDPYFPYVTMLLHGDGTNGAQNNTFLDSSTNNFTITRNGNTTQGSFSPYGSNWSNYFDGSGDYLSTPSSITLGSGDLTIEGWAYPTNTSGGVWYDFRGPDSGSAGNNPVIQWSTVTASKFTVRIDGTNAITSSSTFSTNNWHHVALVRSGTTVTLYVNGTSQGTYTTSTSFAQAYVRIGAYGGDGSVAFTGYASNLRAVIGTAIYTATFTPPTTPLTAVSGTALLTCQSNRFIDNSTNAFTITRNGDVSVQRFSPFSPSDAYSTSTIGGSGYFDGSGDYLTTPTNTALDFGTGDFTVEFWLFPTPLTFNIFLSAPNNGITQIGYDGADDVRYLYFYNSSNIIRDTTSASLTSNQWNHVVLCRSGTTLSLFSNGVRRGTATYSSAISFSTCTIGRYYPGGYDTKGYISDVRMVKGTAVYNPSQTTYTVPTAPLTAIANTNLLCNFTNGGIFDNAMMNNLETVGNAQISTSVKKFGTGSLAFDGSGDYLDTQSVLAAEFGSGDFTIEFWLNASGGIGTTQTVISKGVAGSVGSDYWSIEGSAGGNLTFYAPPSATAYVATTTQPWTSGWAHIAVCRSGANTRMFVNGVQSGSTYSTLTTFGTGGFIRVGSSTYSAARTITGNIDDLRITKGYARYTSNFTPPAAAFPNQ